MRVAAALSEHPVPAQAAGETVGQVLEELGTAPDLAVLFVTGQVSGAFEDIARTVRGVLNPRVLTGATAASVLAGSREVEDRAGVALWAAHFGVDVEPVRLEAFPGADGAILVAGGSPLNRGDGTVLLLPDPFSFPVEAVLAHLSAAAPEVQIVGGMASAARQPGGNLLLLDDEVFRDGAVGAWLPPSVEVTPVVSQGCRPIGQPLVVTASEGNMLVELAGQPALARLTELVEQLSPEDRALATGGLHLGIVIDEHRLDFVRGDFLVRGVLGADRENGVVAVGDQVAVGTTVQFHVRDASTAEEDLWSLMSGRTAEGALVFTCNGRGSNLFGNPDHDATVVSESLGGAPVAGMFCAGELGPVGGRNFLHGFTASVALFRDAPG